MGEMDAPRGWIGSQYRGADHLSAGKPLPRVKNTGNRDVFNPYERNHTAAHIHKRPERLQMGDAGRNHITRAKICQQPCERALLCKPPGKGDMFSIDVGYNKANRLAHPG